MIVDKDRHYEASNADGDVAPFKNVGPDGVCQARTGSADWQCSGFGGLGNAIAGSSQRAKIRTEGQR